MSGPKDHYVAQTYLRSFSVTGHDGYVHAIRKTSLKRLNSIPVSSICYKIDWSTNSVFSKEPRAIEDYLKIFEPKWSGCIKTLTEERFDEETKYLISGYVAYLKTYTPTAARIGKELPAEVVRRRYEILVQKEMEKPDSKYASVIKKIQNSGGIKVRVKDDFVKAMSASNLDHLIRGYLSFPWLILINDTGIPFITSDNPICPRWDERPMPDFYFPVTPKIAILIRSTRDTSAKVPDGFASTTPEGVEMFNSLMAKCAEDLVIFNKDFGVETLVKRFQDWRMEAPVTSCKQGNRTVIFYEERPMHRHHAVSD